MQTIAYRYRILRVLSDERRVIDEIRAGHRLYNELVAIERTRREETRRFWAERGGYLPALTELASAIEAAKALPKGDERRKAWAAVDEIRRGIWERERTAIAATDSDVKTRRKARAKKLRGEAKARGEKLTQAQLTALLDTESDCLTPRDQMRVAIAKEYAERGVNVSAKALAKRLRDAGLVGPTEHIEAKARAAAYAAYQASGVSPGTRGVITDAHASSLAKLGLREQRFARWEGRGAFGVQIQGGATAGALYSGAHTQLRLEKLPPSGRAVAGARRDNRHRVCVRIGSDGRAPVWAEFLVAQHRPLPDSARVMQAKVVVDRVGVHDQWHLVLTAQVDDAQYRAVPVERRAGSVVAVDIGWRSADNTLRVAYWADDRGNHDKVCLPDIAPQSGRTNRQRRSYRETLEHVRELQSLMAEQFYAEDKDAGVYGGILYELHTWLTAHAAVVPQWLAEATAGLRTWRSQPRLNTLVERWLSNRFIGDENIVERLDGWRRTWRHLYEWAAQEHRHALDARGALYRYLATRLAREYETVIVNGADLAGTRQRQSAKQAAPEPVMVADRKRAQAFDAAPGELRKELVRAAAKYGATLIPVAFDSMTCHACGVTCTYDRARSITHECEHCGQEWDQDHNACRNALRERSGGARTISGARNSSQTPAPTAIVRSGSGADSVSGRV